MDANWWKKLSLTEIQRSRAALAAFTAPDADRPEPADDTVRAFCIKVLFEGEDATLSFVNQLKTLNADQRKLLGVTDPFDPDLRKWSLKFGRIVWAIKEAASCLPESYRGTVLAMHDQLNNAFQDFIGNLQVLQIRAKYLQLMPDKPSENS